MLPHVFDSSEKDDNQFSQSEKKAKNDSVNKNLPDDEKAENAIWQGIKSEQAGNLELAAFHYRLAIQHHPECAKAYRLLSNILKKIREKKNDSVVKIDSELSNNIIFQQDLNKSHIGINLTDSRHTSIKNQSLVTTSASIAQSDILPLNLSQPQVSNSVDFSNVNLIPVNLDFNVNNTNSSSHHQSEIVLLPNVETSPSGDMVLQDNLAISKLYVEQALVFFEQKQWEKSINACREALKACPSMGEAYKIWGNCLQKSGNSADAIGIYAKALEIQPNMAEIYCNLGSIYAQSKKWKQAIEYYQKSIIIDPDCAAPHRNLARVWDELGKYDQSEECFFKAIAIKPELITAKNHFDLAHNLAAENKLHRAIACYKHCINLEPSFLNAYVRLAQLLEEDGQTEEALYYYKKLAQLQTGAKERNNQPKSRRQIHNFLFGKKNQQSTPALPQASKKARALRGKKAVPQLSPSKPALKQNSIAALKQNAEQNPNSTEAQFELGQYYFQAEEWQNAITYYLKAIKLASQETKFYLHLGKAWEKSGDALKAHQSFYQAFSLEPEKVTGRNHLLLGNKLLEQRQLNPAIACYRRAITQSPELVESYWQLGRILLSGGNHQGAIACYQQAVKVAPQDAMGYFGLGNALAETKQTEAAINCYHQAAKIAPENADIKHNLGEILFQTENWQDAIQAYREAIAINPDNSWSHNNLGNALLKTQQWQAAADSFYQAIKLKPDFVWSHYNLGEALVELKQWDEALAAYKQAEKIDPKLPRVKEKIAQILRRQSKNSQQEAAMFCEAQIKEDPDNVELYHQAIALNRKNHELYLGLGKALAKQEKLDEAISIFQMGLEIQPNNIELSSELSKAIQARNPELDIQEIAEKVKGITNSFK